MNSVYQKIKDSLSIIEVIEDFTPVIKKGSATVCLCPFHQEKTPSLSINEDKGVFYCFGCNAKGDMFSFVQQITGMDKKATLEYLASKAGIELDKFTKDDPLIHGKKLLTSASLLYNQILVNVLKQNQADYVSSYIQKRGLSLNTINTFMIGFAPGANFLLEFYKKNDINLSLALQTGLLKQAYDKTYDKFSDRLIIPISDPKGQVLGFTSRIFPKDDQSSKPKYLNSSDNQYFHKGRILFGLYQNKASIQKNKRLILVEGNMDVIGSYEHGLDYVLACQGTAFTLDQAKIISRLKVTVDLAFDNDSAGIIAEKKAFEILASLDIEVNKLLIPPVYKDLDEFLANNSFSSLKSMNYFDHLLLTNLSLNSTELYKKNQGIKELLLSIKNASPIFKQLCLNRLADYCNISLEHLTNIEPDNNHLIKAKSELIQNQNLQNSKNFKYNELFNDLLLNFAYIKSNNFVESNAILNQFFTIFVSFYNKELGNIKLEQFTKNTKIIGLVELFTQKINQTTQINYLKSILIPLINNLHQQIITTNIDNLDNSLYQSRINQLMDLAKIQNECDILINQLKI
jgi:DNA primase catalytic core